MNKTLFALAAAFALPAFAQDSAPPPERGDPAPAPVKAMSRAEAMQKTQDNVKKMQALLARISKARSDSERQKLVAEYQQAVEDNLATSKLLAAGVDCPSPAEDAAGDEGDGREVLQERIRQLERRLDRVQANLGQGAGPRPVKTR